MEIEVLEETTYYRIESPRGVMSAPMNEVELDFCRDLGFFTVVAWRGAGNNECYTTKKYKIGKIHKFVRKTTLAEEVLA